MMTRIGIVAGLFMVILLSSCRETSPGSRESDQSSRASQDSLLVIANSTLRSDSPKPALSGDPTPEFDSIPNYREDRLWVGLTGTVSAGSGDTIHVSYVLHNASLSKQDASALDILTAVQPAKIITPGMRLGWTPQSGVLQDSNRIGWLGLGGEAQVAPGDSAAPFYYSAIGLLDIVPYYVHGYTPASTFADEDEHELGEHGPPYWRDSFRDVTVGVVPLPTDRTPLFLARRLRSLTDEACRLQWITAWKICGSVNAKHRAARKAAYAGDLSGACGHIRALRRELLDVFSDSMTWEARSLVNLNAEHFLRTHCGKQEY
jgi:hypothetical protein